MRPRNSGALSSDSNAPITNQANATFGFGGGSSFTEMQFYPPGEPPSTIAGGISCDDPHYCAAMAIFSLECIPGFTSNFVASCNANCVEPVNFAFIQRNGVPTGAPSPQDSFPTTNGAQYTQFHFQTDVALSEEVTCGPATGGTGTLAGCTVPPQGPGGFYPYWSQFQSGGSCSLLFGNVSAGSTFGKDAQYGTNGFNTFGYPQFISSSHNNPCL